jgi:hypothetical protein
MIPIERMVSVAFSFPVTFIGAGEQYPLLHSQARTAYFGSRIVCGVAYGVLERNSAVVDEQRYGNDGDVNITARVAEDRVDAVVRSVQDVCRGLAQVHPRT